MNATAGAGLATGLAQGLDTMNRSMNDISDLKTQRQQRRLMAQREVQTDQMFPLQLSQQQLINDQLQQQIKTVNMQVAAQNLKGGLMFLANTGQVDGLNQALNNSQEARDLVGFSDGDTLSNTDNYSSDHLDQLARNLGFNTYQEAVDNNPLGKNGYYVYTNKQGQNYLLDAYSTAQQTGALDVLNKATQSMLQQKQTNAAISHQDVRDDVMRSFYDYAKNGEIEGMQKSLDILRLLDQANGNMQMMSPNNQLAMRKLNIANNVEGFNQGIYNDGTITGKFDSLTSESAKNNFAFDSLNNRNIYDSISDQTRNILLGSAQHSSLFKDSMLKPYMNEMNNQAVEQLAGAVSSKDFNEDNIPYVRKTILNLFGLAPNSTISDSDVKDIMRKSQFQLALNDYIKALSGQAVSKQEMERSVQAIGSLNQNDKTLASKVSALVNSKIQRLQEIRGRSPVLFDSSYMGDALNNLQRYKSILETGLGMTEEHKEQKKASYRPFAKGVQDSSNQQTTNDDVFSKIDNDAKSVK